MDKKIIKLLIIPISLVFISSYMISTSGYYEYNLQRKTIITNEKIKQFEEDIKNNKEIDLIDYLDDKEINYTNKFTTLIYNISDNSNKLARKTIKYIFKKLGSLIEE